MDRQINRNDILRDVQYILAKHSVDLQKCQYSCSTDIVTLFGALKKSPRGDFTSNGVVGLCRELKALPYLRDVLFRLDNWAIDSNLTSVLFLEKRKDGESEEEEPDTPEEKKEEESEEQEGARPFDDVFL